MAELARAVCEGRMNRKQPPDFIIIGAMRAGTTALSERLSHHPEIGISRLKETDYFVAEKNARRGMRWYRSLFPEDKPICGEASPNYTKNDVFAGVPERIQGVRPNVKLIYIVRDPVDRFWSHYNHTWLLRGGLPPPDELLNEPEGAHILASSMYHRQLMPYFRTFPSDQILIIDFDEFVSDAPATLDVLRRFLGAAAGFDFAAPNAANSATALAQTPGWALKLSQQNALVGLRGALPAAAKDRIRRVLSRLQPAPRRTPPISDDARQCVRDALANDAAKFRSLTGRAFPRWSI